MADLKKMETKYKGIFTKLKKVSPKVKTNTLYVYLRNLDRLHKLNNEGDLPSSGEWLKNKQLLEKFDKLNLSRRRLLSVAAVKGAKAYGIVLPNWTERLSKASDAYEKLRLKRRITAKEKSKWPKDGLQSLLKAAKEEQRLVKKVMKKNNKKLKDLLTIQRALVLLMYAHHPLRLDFADMNVKPPEKDKQENFLFKKPREGWTILLRRYKTFKSKGELKIKIKRSVSVFLTKFVPILQELTTHGKLLTNNRGDALSRNGLSKLLQKLTAQHFDKGFSTQLIRVLFATQHSSEIMKAKELTDELQHSLAQSVRYTRST